MSYVFGKSARTYDSMGFDTGTGALRFLDQQLHRHGLKVDRLLDLGCGTGTFAILCSLKRGWEVSGLDASEHMLRVAREKARRSKALVRFFRADMRSFKSKTKVDIVTSWSGSLNYLHGPSAILATFGNVARVLVSRGLFAFDMNDGLEYVRQDGMFHFTRREDFIEARNHYLDPTTSLFHTRITSFTRLPKGGYERIEEHQVERPYSPTEVQRSLGKCGFGATTFFADFNGTLLGRRPRHYVCVAVRN